MWIVIFEAKRTGCRHLGHVFTRLSPMKMPGFARQNNHAAWRIGLYLVTLERFAKPNVEDARHDRVDAIFRMLVRHQLCVGWHLDPDNVRSGFAGMADQDGKTQPGTPGTASTRCL